MPVSSSIILKLIVAVHRYHMIVSDCILWFTAKSIRAQLSALRHMYVVYGWGGGRGSGEGRCVGVFLLPCICACI